MTMPTCAMPRSLFTILLAGSLLTGACKKTPQHPAPPAAKPAPATEPGYAGVPETPQTPAAKPATKQADPAKPAAKAEEPPQAISAPESVNIDKNDAENRLIKAEVLKRIDVMPNLKDDEKDKLYVQVERARGMGKVITIPFASGARALQAQDLAAITRAIHLPQIEKFSQDPTVVFVVLGYADKKGDPKMNLEISTKRADSVVKILKERAGIMNVVHAVGMGGSEIFDSAHREKNRVVEVWAILP